MNFSFFFSLYINSNDMNILYYFLLKTKNCILSGYLWLSISKQMPAMEKD